MIIISSGRLLDILTLGNRKVSAMGLWPLVIFRNREDKKNLRLLNHELIHHRQQLELLLLPYYFWYLVEYWSSMLTNGFNHDKAYHSVSFEREAFENEGNPDYLKQRKFLSSWPYFKRKFN